jgi:hypothetical protein
VGQSHDALRSAAADVAPSGRGAVDAGWQKQSRQYVWATAGSGGGMPNQALEQTRDSVLRYGEVVGCELLNFFVM